MDSVNCYSEDWGCAQLLESASHFGRNANLILASLGPKPSAVALYSVHRQLQESCLVYAPCKNYNEDYSDGIGDSISLEWHPDFVVLAASPEV